MPGPVRTVNLTLPTLYEITVMKSRKPKIEVVVIDPVGNHTDAREFDTKKEAREWVKRSALSAEYWERASESEGYHIRNVSAVRLMEGNECIQDWLPAWHEEPAEGMTVVIE